MYTGLSDPHPIEANGSFAIQLNGSRKESVTSCDYPNHWLFCTNQGLCLSCYFFLLLVFSLLFVLQVYPETPAEIRASLRHALHRRVLAAEACPKLLVEQTGGRGKAGRGAGVCRWDTASLECPARLRGKAKALPSRFSALKHTPLVFDGLILELFLWTWGSFQTDCSWSSLCPLLSKGNRRRARLFPNGELRCLLWRWIEAT